MDAHFAPTNLAASVIELMRALLEWQEHIERALRPMAGAISFDDVVASVLRQERHFYEFEGCCIIMQVEEYPRVKGYHCFLACGTTEAILAAEPHITAIAKDIGCTRLSISGRVGWPRRLKPHGWKHSLSVLHKEI